MRPFILYIRKVTRIKLYQAFQPKRTKAHYPVCILQYEIASRFNLTWFLVSYLVTWYELLDLPLLLTRQWKAKAMWRKEERFLSGPSLVASLIL
ncbi:Uncharacterized protein TCM_037900 [Theobroma cacao]|uniref:Uncharacterized protein n=1 Tax=Theobroma cacao TaxID=3641 RepID=A0A061GMR2_THECC|nr:Uncharacterized protein TCM_037900 [Theobroma cacao]